MKRFWTFDRDARRRFNQRVTRIRRPALLGTLRRSTPLSTRWGYDRGRPVDRYYIEQFLDRHRRDIRGDVLEVKDRRYTDRFGVGVTRSEVIDSDRRNAAATIVSDLARADALESGSFDCCLITQTLQYVYDLRSALCHLRRGLREGGVLLATVPAVSRLDAEADYDDYWRFTPASCTRLFGDAFGRDHVTVRAYGNVLTAIAFMTGMAQEELSAAELEFEDELFPIVVGIRAVKRGAA